MSSSLFKILVVGVHWPPETFLGRLIRGLADAGVEVTVACGQKPNADWLDHPYLHWLPVTGWNIMETPIPVRFFRLLRLLLRGLIKDLKGVTRIAAWPAASWTEQVRNLYKLLPFTGHRWDVIYFPWNSAAINFFPLLDNGIPVVVSCRGTQIKVAPHDPTRQPFVQALRTSFQKATAVHCVSDDIKQEAVRYGLNPDKAWTIYPAVDPDFFHPLPRRPEAEASSFRILATGSLNWIKGYEYALLAVRRLVDLGLQVSYRIIGDGPDHQRLLYTIDDLELQGQVQLLGKLSPVEVREELQRSDAFLLSSISEGISNAALEAMACGLPLVTTNCGGMGEAVRDGMEGFVVPLRDWKAMAQALLCLAGDQDRRRSMGDAARQRILGEFTLKRQIDQFIELYEKILAR